jgi:hypothetical protein
MIFWFLDILNEPPLQISRNTTVPRKIVWETLLSSVRSNGFLLIYKIRKVFRFGDVQ